MISKNIKFKNFAEKSKKLLIANHFKKLKNSYFKKKLNLLSSLSDNYKYSYNKKIIYKYKKFNNFVVTGMGGSILGTKAIYYFLNHKIKKNFFFVDNLNSRLNFKKKNFVNIIVSKSGNTLETIANSNLLLKNKKNIFISENTSNYLNILAKKMKHEIIEHKNYIGGRYSVLSEVGMLPAELMGLKEIKFKKLNYLIKNKKFVNNLIGNVSSILNLVKKGKNLSILLNYDGRSENLFNWYQQLTAESLGKKSKGILPIISKMPKDNHSLMQFYLDGPQKNFYTFFSVKENNSNKISNKHLLKSHSYLKNKNLSKYHLEVLKF